MKRNFAFGGLALAIILFTFYACDNGPSSASDQVLNRPPFKGLTDSIRQFPKDATLYLNRGLLLSQQNLHELATADYKKAWELRPDEATALEYAANLMLINDGPAAVKFLQECRKQFPGNGEFNRRLSEAYALSGRRKEALAEYDDLIARDSLNFMAWYERGLLLIRLKDTAAAEASLERSYAIQPVTYTALALAQLYYVKMNPRVITLCDDILQKDTVSANVDALFLKGIYYSDKKEYAQALSLFEDCIKADWKFADAHIEKGIVYFEQKDYAKALSAFTVAATVENTNADAYFWQARCNEMQGDKEKAAENYERALSFDPGFLEAEIRLERLRN